MPTMIVLVSGQKNRDFPPIMEAARVLPKAHALGCDRIRIELADGARVAEFPLATVARFIRAHGLQPQPDRRLRRDRGDYEWRRPVYPGWTRQGDPDDGSP